MVGYLILLKMLNCKIQQKKSHYSLDEHSKSHISFKSVTVKNEGQVSEDLMTTCRVCLKYGVIPIFGNDTDNLCDSLCKIGGIEVSQDDEHPKFLCQPCKNLLKSATLFRKTAQHSDEILRLGPRDVMSDNEYPSNTDNGDFEYEPVKDCKQKVNRCRKCDIDFKTLKEYRSHIASPEHVNFRRTCPICNNSYTTQYYEKHLALHRLETKFMCDICGKKYVIKGQFDRHRRTHFNNFPFKCTLCPYKGKFKESLKLHMRTHSGERPYQCSQCPARFVNKSNLNRHEFIHKEDYEYKCDSCGKGFYSKQLMATHFKVSHYGIKDHICNLCGKAFGYRRDMIKHQIRVHKTRGKLRTGRMPLYLQVETNTQDMAE